MKKCALFVLGAVSLIVLLAHLGPIIGFLISLAVLYFAYKKFVRSDSTGSKVFWFIVGIIALCLSIGNVPAIIGIVALAVLYFVYKSWNRQKDSDPEPEDPFDNFEKQWKQIM
ncbi:flagellar basal body rod protein [Sporolactobacillus sp. THM7-7]|nr:flagellar basal body rod protein [Sporolactobacillus sp. THM7-7]